MIQEAQTKAGLGPESLVWNLLAAWSAGLDGNTGVRRGQR